MTLWLRLSVTSQHCTETANGSSSVLAQRLPLDCSTLCWKICGIYIDGLTGVTERDKRLSTPPRLFDGLQHPFTFTYLMTSTCSMVSGAPQKLRVGHPSSYHWQTARKKNWKRCTQQSAPLPSYTQICSAVDVQQMYNNWGIFCQLVKRQQHFN